MKAVTTGLTRWSYSPFEADNQSKMEAEYPDLAKELPGFIDGLSVEKIGAETASFKLKPVGVESITFSCLDERGKLHTSLFLRKSDFTGEKIPVKLTELKPARRYSFVLGGEAIKISPPAIDNLSYSGTSGSCTYSFFLGMINHTGSESISSSLEALSELPQNPGPADCITLSWQDPPIPAETYSVYALYEGEEFKLIHLGVTSTPKFSGPLEQMEVIARGEDVIDWMKKMPKVGALAQEISSPFYFRTAGI